MFQSLESKVVSASSTLKVSNVCSRQYYDYSCHIVQWIKPWHLANQMKAIKQLRV